MTLSAKVLKCTYTVDNRPVAASFRCREEVIA
jgi:hypothetical protein